MGGFWCYLTKERDCSVFHTSYLLWKWPILQFCSSRKRDLLLCYNDHCYYTTVSPPPLLNDAAAAFQLLFEWTQVVLYPCLYSHCPETSSVNYLINLHYLGFTDIVLCVIYWCVCQTFFPFSISLFCMSPLHLFWLMLGFILFTDYLSSICLILNLPTFLENVAPRSRTAVYFVNIEVNWKIHLMLVYLPEHVWDFIKVTSHFFYFYHWHQASLEHLIHISSSTVYFLSVSMKKTTNKYTLLRR